MNLRITPPNGQTWEYKLQGKRIVVGRAAGNDLVLADQTVSRRHAELIIEDDSGMVVVEELGSRYGTFINGKKVTTVAPFMTGDVLQIGAFIIKLGISRGMDSWARSTGVNDTQPMKPVKLPEPERATIHEFEPDRRGRALRYLWLVLVLLALVLLVTVLFDYLSSDTKQPRGQDVTHTSVLGSPSPPGVLQT